MILGELKYQLGRAEKWVADDIIHPIERGGTIAIRAVEQGAERLYNTEIAVASNALKAQENISKALVSGTSQLAKDSNKIVAEGVNLVGAVEKGVEGVTTNLPLVAIAVGIGALLFLRR